MDSATASAGGRCWCSRRPGSPCRRPAAAQVEIAGFRFEGDVEAGWRFFVDEPAKTGAPSWEEYRDLPGGPFLRTSELRIFRPDESYSGRDRRAAGGGRRTRSTPSAGGGSACGSSGSTGTRFPTSTRPMPDSLPRRSRGASSRCRRCGRRWRPTTRHRPWTRSAQRWDQARMFFAPHAHAGAGAEGRVHADPQERRSPLQHGVRQPRQQLLRDPRAYRADDPRLPDAVGRGRRDNWQLQFGYVLSIFRNDLSAVQADNPCSGAAPPPAGCARVTRARPRRRGRQVSLSAGQHGPHVHGERWRQPALVAHTTDGQFHLRHPAPERGLPAPDDQPDIAGDPESGAAPEEPQRQRPDDPREPGSGRRRPMRDVTLSAKYRLFDYSGPQRRHRFPGVRARRPLDFLRAAKRRASTTSGRTRTPTPAGRCGATPP